MKDYKERDIYQRSVRFAVTVAKIVDTLPPKPSYQTVGKQLIRSATSISANIAEGSGGVSRNDFVNFLSISRKSAIESEHWLNMLKEFGIIISQDLMEECVEIIKILTSIISATKTKS